MKILITLLGLMLALGVVGGGIYIFTRATPLTTPAVVSMASTTLASSTPSVLPARPVPSGFAEYKTVQYRFDLLYPNELTVNEYKGDANSITITFQNAEKGEGFQIFIVPDYDTQVTPERFKQDEPSGVRNNVTTVTVGGTTAAAFNSTNASLGDTYEIWFLREGYLYEITTLKPLDAWLQNILQSWEFIN